MEWRAARREGEWTYREFRVPVGLWAPLHGTEEEGQALLAVYAARLEPALARLKADGWQPCGTLAMGKLDSLGRLVWHGTPGHVVFDAVWVEARRPVWADAPDDAEFEAVEESSSGEDSDLFWAAQRAVWRQFPQAGAVVALLVGWLLLGPRRGVVGAAVVYAGLVLVRHWLPFGTNGQLAVCGAFTPLLLPVSPLLLWGGVALAAAWWFGAHPVLAVLLAGLGWGGLLLVDAILWAMLPPCWVSGLRAELDPPGKRWRR